MKETVTISLEEYQELLRESKFLEALMGCGLDNWDGYAIAQEYMDEGE